ncbi:MAG TPA: helix-turn-helix domain-containing protein [Tepidisphaeraceae bacterium]|jgi:DNA-binding CsgD family transcriptional regulator
MWGNLPLGITDIQFRAIELAIQGHRDTQIAQMLGLDRKTIWNWKTHDENYRDALTRARTHLHSTTVDRCQNIAQQATLVLADFLSEDNVPNIRLRAAQILLSTASRIKPEKVKLPSPPQQQQEEDDFPPPFLPPKVG